MKGRDYGFCFQFAVAGPSKTAPAIFPHRLRAPKIGVHRNSRPANKADIGEIRPKPPSLEQFQRLLIGPHLGQIEQALQSAASSTAGFVDLSNELRQQAGEFQTGMMQLKGIIGEANAVASEPKPAPVASTETKPTSALLKNANVDRAEPAWSGTPGGAKNSPKVSPKPKAETVSASFADF